MVPPGGAIGAIAFGRATLALRRRRRLELVARGNRVVAGAAVESVVAVAAIEVVVVAVAIQHVVAGLAVQRVVARLAIDGVSGRRCRPRRGRDGVAVEQVEAAHDDLLGAGGVVLEGQEGAAADAVDAHEPDDVGVVAQDHVGIARPAVERPVAGAFVAGRGAVAAIDGVARRPAAASGRSPVRP